MPHNATIKLTNITRIFLTDELETHALRGVDLEIFKGDYVSISGPSGCGKSTLLNIIGMLDSPTDGHYQFMDENIAGYNEKQLSEIRKYNIGFIFQSFNLIDELTVFENVELPLQYQQISRSERKQRVEAILKRVAIDHRADHLPQQLSGGQQQRVAVARALVTNPKLILADEPTGNLDPELSNRVLRLFEEFNRAGVTILLATHDLGLVNTRPQYRHLELNQGFLSEVEGYGR